MWERGLKPTVKTVVKLPKSPRATKIKRSSIYSAYAAQTSFSPSPSLSLSSSTPTSTPTATAIQIARRPAPAAPWASVQQAEVPPPFSILQLQEQTHQNRPLQTGAQSPPPQPAQPSRQHFIQGAGGVLTLASTHTDNVRPRRQSYRVLSKTSKQQRRQPNQQQQQPQQSYRVLSKTSKQQRRQPNQHQQQQQQSYQLPKTSNWANAATTQPTGRNVTPTLNQLVADSKRNREKVRNNATNHSGADRGVINEGRGKNKTKKRSKGSSQPPPEAPSLFDFLATKQPKKMTNAQRKKMKQKEQAEARKAQMLADEAKNKKRHAVLTKSQLDIQQKMVLNEELTEEEKAMAKEVTERRNRKKRKKKPTRLKRILNQERKEVFIAAHGGNDPLALAMMKGMKVSASTPDSVVTDKVNTKVNMDNNSSMNTSHEQKEKGEHDDNAPQEERTEQQQQQQQDDLGKDEAQEGQQDGVSSATNNRIGDDNELSDLKNPDTSLECKTEMNNEVATPTTTNKKKIHVKYPRVANKSVIREYVEQNLSKVLDVKITSVLKTLMEYQEKARKLDPIKAKHSRRLLFGLREVRRSVKTKKSKAVIVATNIDESSSQGGLNDLVGEILKLARDNEIPVIYSMTSRRLGKSLRKPKTSCVSILSGDGAHAELKESIIMAKTLATQWKNGIRTTTAATVSPGAPGAAPAAPAVLTATAATGGGGVVVEEGEKKSHSDNIKTDSTRRQLNPSAGEFTPSWVTN